MNWINALYDLYEKNEYLAGEYRETGEGSRKKQSILLPLYHSTVLAQIEITIDSEGNFLRARILDKAEATTLIPVTEQSASRTSKPSPHPLMDNLTYVAGDYDELAAIEPDKKGEVPKYHTRYENFMDGLGQWYHSEHAHPKAMAVYQYIQKECLIADLIEAGVLQPDESGKISDKHKIQNIAQVDAFIRFCVETPGVTPDPFDTTGRFAPEIWRDQTLQQSYIQYIAHRTGTIALCYLTGQNAQTVMLHPKKIRNEGDGTKLFSSNDSDGFTFRGRFTNDKEAFSIGSEASQKIHNALKWIIRKQGYTRDGLCVAAWESDLKPYASFYQDPVDIVLESDDDDPLADDESATADTNYITAQKLNTALLGYKAEISNRSNMVILALDAATPGRLAITYFNSLSTSRYLDNITFWHESCRWLHEKSYGKDQRFIFEGMASFKDIALALYGTEQNKQLTLKANSDGKAPMQISIFQRLTPCITERKRIPSDMVRLAVMRASSPLSFENYNWRKILAIACSLVKKEKYEQNGEVWEMSLDKNCKDRSYLYGRLLAVADNLEESTYEWDEKRTTNAMRYMNVFSQRPFRTWQIIEERLNPYIEKKSKGLQIFYKNLLHEIHDMFTFEQFSNDSRLDGLYLLGFHSQKRELLTKKNNNTEMDNENHEDGGEKNE